MNQLRLEHVIDSHLTVFDGAVALLRYVYRPDTPTLESPKPYLHPLRTRGDQVVSLFRPHDHVWHKGIAWSLPHLGEENFWGGPTYVHGRFYVQLPNNGEQKHRTISDITAGEEALFAHELEWIAQDGRMLVSEHRSIRAVLLDDDAWMLQFSTAMTNVSGEAISIGSPTTKGRENAGYGGLFWRGPRSFTGGRLVSATSTGGDELRGGHHEWLGFSGQHDESGASSTVLIVDHHENPRHPPQWFGRSEDFACLNPAPFFSEELDFAADSTIRFRYGIGISDSGAEGAHALADRVRVRIT
ncbi:PmoA family protein [Rathayibacter sp. VKM Ac-2835]|uniref:DUF6807 domain-containing protein n=1 Tax=Rathayibacter sp. VKM Ac-2835 TaxID=2739043 RepID=UPI0015670140|nr:PmoA family protein [Rathayibacter sp. VKM Ac-2835]NRG43025.1 PmoA family protein [Rathayibacter sp. VKM Ac-2835]